MLRLRPTLNLPLSLAAVAALGACSDDDSKPAPTEDPTIAAIVAGNADFDTLEAALTAADLTATFEGEGEFTVFAPTDAAFEALPEGALDALLADKEALAEVLTYHVVAGRVGSAAVVELDSATTLQGEDITIEVKDGKVVLNGTVNVTTTDIEASNGVVHVIDAVLMPPEPEPTSNTIVDVVVGNADFDTLEAAVIAADLAGTLAGPGPFTVFAPTDAAFEALPEGALDALLADKSALTDVLTYHVVSGEVGSSQVVTLPRATALNGVHLKITVDDGAVILNDTVRVTATDIEADNGVIHVIDAVLLPPQTITDIVVGSDDFSTLEAAVSAAGLAATLDGEDDYTVFAPTNAAIAALGADNLNALLADTEKLTDVLLFHVVPGTKYASDVVAASALEMANGLSNTISVDGGAAKIGNATIVTTDIYARNGVIHVIDAVLMPPPTIAEAAAADPRFSTLVTALDAAGLVEALDGTAPLTVFAPTNDAFAKIAEADLNALLADKDALTDVLLYHVVDGTKLAADVVGTPVHTMKNGAIVPVVVDGGTAKIGGATITTTDLKVRNGVIHVIDTVIVPPPTLAEIAASNADFSTLLAAVSAAELATALDTLGPFTVFAPTNAAFAKIPEADLNALLADKPALTNVLFYHVADGAVPASVAVTLDKATMKNGAELDFTYDPGQMTLAVGPATVTAADIWARNGVIHVIDTVLLPPSL